MSDDEFFYWGLLFVTGAYALAAVIYIIVEIVKLIRKTDEGS